MTDIDSEELIRRLEERQTAIGNCSDSQSWGESLGLDAALSIVDDMKNEVES